MTSQDIRQSDKWAKYLTSLGWRILKTKNGINIAAQHTLFGAIVKIQRPCNISLQDLKEAENLVKNRLFIKIEPAINQDLSILENFGYVKSRQPLLPSSTTYINLTLPKNKLWDNISRGGRYAIRRALKEGAQTKWFQNPSDTDLEKFYIAFEKVGKMKGFYVQSFEDLKTKRDVFGKESFLVEVYTKEGTLAGANFYLGHEKTAWFIHGGITEEGRRGKEGYILTWQAILYFKKLGYTTLDLEGIEDERFPKFTKNWKGFSDFKKKFGGEVVQFQYPHIKYKIPLLRNLSNIL